MSSNYEHINSSYFQSLIARVPILVLGSQCPACFRCFPASAHLVQMTASPHQRGHQGLHSSINDPLIWAWCVVAGKPAGDDLQGPGLKNKVVFWSLFSMCSMTVSWFHNTFLFTKFLIRPGLLRWLIVMSPTLKCKGLTKHKATIRKQSPGVRL